ncbi:hypothetical protein XOCgx_1365 [Xanthomonas oryzae pv. oryzicola]|nr:hypothetical protein XOCgx_1365 [Xanthomonas oryzae pv. oryzicola]
MAAKSCIVSRHARRVQVAGLICRRDGRTLRQRFATQETSR